MYLYVIQWKSAMFFIKNDSELVLIKMNYCGLKKSLLIIIIKVSNVLHNIQNKYTDQLFLQRSLMKFIIQSLINIEYLIL